MTKKIQKKTRKIKFTINKNHRENKLCRKALGAILNMSQYIAILILVLIEKLTIYINVFTKEVPYFRPFVCNEYESCIIVMYFVYWDKQFMEDR